MRASEIFMFQRGIFEIKGMSSSISSVFMFIGTHALDGDAGRCRMLKKPLSVRSFQVLSGSPSDRAFVGSWRAHQIVAEILSSPQAEQEQIIEVACGDDDSLRSRVRRMIASLDGGTKGVSLQPASSDSLHGTGDLVFSRKIEFSATRETWAGHTRDNRSSPLLIHVFSGKNESFDSVIAGFETSQNSSLEKLVAHGVTPGGRAFVAFNQVNGVPIHEYLDIFTTSSTQRRDLFDRVRDAILVANEAGLHHGALVKESIVISEIDGKPFPTIVGLGLQSLAFSGLSNSTETDLVVVEEILKKLEEKFGVSGVLLGRAQLSAAAFGTTPRFSFGDGIVQTVLPIMESVITPISRILTRQAMLGLTFFSLLILTCLGIDSGQIVQSTTPFPPGTGASMVDGIQTGPAQEIFTPGGGSGDVDGEGDEIISQDMASKSEKKGATHRITPQRRPASVGTGTLQAR